MTAKEIKRLRETLGLTQEAFAAKLGVNRVTLADWERDAHGPRGLSLKALQSLAGEIKAKVKKKKAGK